MVAGLALKACNLKLLVDAEVDLLVGLEGTFLSLFHDLVVDREGGVQSLEGILLDLSHLLVVKLVGDVIRLGSSLGARLAPRGSDRVDQVTVINA